MNREVNVELETVRECSLHSDWVDLTDYIKSQSGSFLSLRKMACGVHAREIEKSTITPVLNECLRDFPHIGAPRKD